MNKRTPTKDYYKILEISPNATEKEIKKAYQKLSKLYHPDKTTNKSDEEKQLANELMLKINEAYEILSNKDKKKLYDEKGICDGEDHLSGEYMEKERKTRVKFNISINELFTGVKKTVKIPVKSEGNCKTCDGTGHKNKKKSQCNKCNGKGQLQKPIQIGPGQIAIACFECDNCDGNGINVNNLNKCQSCNGTGKHCIDKEIEIKPNHDISTKFTVKNNNEDISLIPNLNIDELNSEYKMEYADQSVKHKYDLTLNHNIDIRNVCVDNYNLLFNHPNGKKYCIKFNEPIKNDKIYYIKNLGLPFTRGLFGNLLVKFEYKFPTSNYSKNDLVDYYTDYKHVEPTGDHIVLSDYKILDENYRGRISNNDEDDDEDDDENNTHFNPFQQTDDIEQQFAQQFAAQQCNQS